MSRRVQQFSSQVFIKNICPLHQMILLHHIKLSINTLMDFDIPSCGTISQYNTKSGSDNRQDSCSNPVVNPKKKPD